MPRDLTNRLADLEQEVAVLRAEAGRSAREPRPMTPRVVRWARTVAEMVDEAEEYPEASDWPNTYPFVFVDAAADRVAGQQTVSATDRQAAPRDRVTNLADGRPTLGIYHYIPVGTLLAVWHDGRRWWTNWQTPNIFPVTIGGAAVPSGGTKLVTLPDGREVTATNQTGGSLEAGRASVYQNAVNKAWYLTGGAGGEGGGDRQAIVMVYGATHESGTCVWPGRVTVPNEEATGYCSDQFPPDTECWLVVLNSQDGSTATEKGTLRVGEKYIGHWVGTLGEGESQRDVYAIRHQPRVARRFLCTLAANLASADATAQIDNLEALDGGSAPAITSAVNVLHCSGLYGAACIIEEDWGNASEGEPRYILTAMDHVVRTPVTAIDYDATSKTLRRKTRQITVQHEGDESDWQSILTLSTTGAVWAGTVAETGGIQHNMTGEVNTTDGVKVARFWADAGLAKLGSRVLVWKDWIDDELRFVRAGRNPPREFMALLFDDMRSDDGTALIAPETVIPLDGEEGVFIDAASNIFGLSARQYQIVLLAEDLSDGGLGVYVKQVRHESHPFIHQLRYDVEEHAFELQYQSFTVMWDGEPDDVWLPWHFNTLETFVQEVYWDPVARQLRAITYDIWLNEDADNPDNLLLLQFANRTIIGGVGMAGSTLVASAYTADVLNPSGLTVGPILEFHIRLFVADVWMGGEGNRTLFKSMNTAYLVQPGAPAHYPVFVGRECDEEEEEEEEWTGPGLAATAEPLGMLAWQQQPQTTAAQIYHYYHRS